MQKLYGKTGAEIGTLVEGFCFVLSEYSMIEIIAAIKVYIKRHSDIPAPADLENILNPPPAKPCWATYITLRKKIKDDVYVTLEQREYLAYCDRWAMSAALDEKQDYLEARRIVDSYAGSWE